MCTGRSAESETVAEGCSLFCADLSNSMFGKNVFRTSCPLHHYDYILQWQANASVMSSQYSEGHIDTGKTILKRYFMCFFFFVFFWDKLFKDWKIKMTMGSHHVLPFTVWENKRKLVVYHRATFCFSIYPFW